MGYCCIISGHLSLILFCTYTRRVHESSSYFEAVLIHSFVRKQLVPAATTCNHRDEYFRALHRLQTDTATVSRRRTPHTVVSDKVNMIVERTKRMVYCKESNGRPPVARGWFHHFMWLLNLRCDKILSIVFTVVVSPYCAFLSRKKFCYKRLETRFCIARKHLGYVKHCGIQFVALFDSVSVWNLMRLSLSGRRLSL